jgi:hypothetical protein
MAGNKDDLEAVRTIVKTLEEFEDAEKERIIRWSMEKLGLEGYKKPPFKQPSGNEQSGHIESSASGKITDIKTFISEKNPSSDKHFAVTVAYYYRFVAPQEQRKDFISGDDLQNACRQVGRERLDNPGQTLINAHHTGIMDKAGERGAYCINTVGENLVAMTLPAGKISTTSKKSNTGSKAKNQAAKSSKKRRK